LTQLLKGTLDMCLLATIAQRPCYGYELVQQLAQQGLSLVSEGYLVASRDGPQRKYYRLLPAGAKQLEQWQAEWERFAKAVEHILKGARSDAQSRPAHPTTDR
jgi:PadR family transcriptional regulator, regulatory protein PadR